MMNAYPLILISSALMLAYTHVWSQTELIKNDAGALIEYRGVAPQGLKLLAEHRVIAKYTGAPFRVCLAETGSCPERCGGSGEFATFEVMNYLFFKKYHKPSDDRQKDFTVRISDYNKQEVGDKKLNAFIKNLKVGDLLLLEQKHFYGEVKPGSYRSVRPFTLLKKITTKEAGTLREKAGQR